MSGQLVPVHPEATDAPDVLRWVVPVGILGFVGEPVDVPPPLQDLYAAGVLTGSAVVEPAAVLLRIGEGRSWGAEGALVRRALQAALEQPGGWRQPPEATGDDVLRAAVDDVLAGEVGDFVRGHGGVIRLLEVAGEEVVLELGGACAGCSASGVTVRHRFEAALRQRYPRLRNVVAREAQPRRSRLIQLLPTRRRP